MAITCRCENTARPLRRVLCLSSIILNVLDFDHHWSFGVARMGGCKNISSMFSKSFNIDASTTSSQY